MLVSIVYSFQWYDNLMDAKLKHLEMIQGVINRMGANSFMLKSWAVVIVSALFALAAKDTNGAFIIVAYLPTFVLWGLDGCYLRQERLFRALYINVAARQPEKVDFSMSTTPHDDDVDGWLGTCLSNTIAPFYGVIVMVIVLVMIAVFRMDIITQS